MGTGKKRIQIKKVDNIKYRRVTFTRRRNGLFKKAAELSALTGCNVCVLAFSPSVLTPFLYGDLSLLEAAAGLSNASPNFEIGNCCVSVGDGNLKSSLVLGESSDCKDSYFTEDDVAAQKPSPNFEIGNCCVSVGDGNLKSSLVLGESSDCKDSYFTEDEVSAQKSSPNFSCPNSEIGNCGYDTLKGCLGLGDADEPVDVDAANASCSNVNDMMMMNWHCYTDSSVNDDAFPCSSNSSAMFELSCADYGITSSTSVGDNIWDDDVYAGLTGDLVNLDAFTSSGFSNYEIASCSNYPSVGNNMGGACGDDKDSSFMDDVYAGLTGDIVNLDAVTSSSISDYEITSFSYYPSVGQDLSFKDDDVFAGLMGNDNEDLVGAVTSSSNNVMMMMDSNVNALNMVPCSSSSATLDYEHYNYTAANYMIASTGRNENGRSLLGFSDVMDFEEKMACEAAAGDMISELYSEDPFIILP